MDNIVDIKSKKSKKLLQREPTEYSFSEEVEKDITNLCATLKIPRDQAINVARDFYKKYPMLVEYVRSPEILLGK